MPYFERSVAPRHGGRTGNLDRSAPPAWPAGEGRKRCLPPRKSCDPSPSPKLASRASEQPTSRTLIRRVSTQSPNRVRDPGGDHASKASLAPIDANSTDTVGLLEGASIRRGRSAGCVLEICVERCHDFDRSPRRSRPRGRPIGPIVARARAVRNDHRVFPRSEIAKDLEAAVVATLVVDEDHL